MRRLLVEALAIAKDDPLLDDETILAAFRLSLEYSVRTGGPGFYNQVRFVAYSRVHACLQATIRTSIAHEWWMAADPRVCISVYRP